MRLSLLSWLACSLLWALPALAADITPSDRVKRNVVLRAGPDGDAAALGALFPGEKAELLDEVPGWYHVRLPDGRSGYLSKVWTIEIAEEGPPLAGEAAGPLKVHVIDVGTGLAIFIEGPGFTMLYDAGSQDDLATGPDNRVVAYIKAVRPDVQAIDHLVLSHPHKDHLELMPDVFDRFEIRNVWNSGAVNKTRGYCRFLKKVAAEPGVLYHDAIATGGTYRVTFRGKTCSGEVALPQAAMMSGQPVALGPGTSMTILYRDASHHHDPNENTVVVRLDHGQGRVLLPGDAEGGGRELPGALPSASSIEGKLVQCCAGQLNAQVLVAGHHGSLTSSRRAFLDKVSAQIFVISSGPHPYSGVTLPDIQIAQELGNRGIVRRTDIDDEQCMEDETKIGPDADESPGGCESVIVTVLPSGQVSSDYNRNAD